MTRRISEKLMAQAVRKVGRRHARTSPVTPTLPKQYRRKNAKKWIIHHLTQTDAYKYSMGQLYFHRHNTVQCRWEFKLRSKGVRIDHLFTEIMKEVDHLCTLRYTPWELAGIKDRMPWLAQDWIEELEKLQLMRKYIHIEHDPADECGIKIWAEGPQLQVFWFEIYMLQIIQHLYFDDLEIDWDASKAALDEVVRKWKDAANRGIEFTVSDFGIRRSIDGDWNEYMVKTLLKELPGVFVGTSNVYLAIKLGCKAIGTFAHELYAVYQGLPNIPLRMCQTQVLEDWTKEYRGDLGIALSDNFGFRAFLRDFDKYYAKLFDGLRHDSGNPYTWGEMFYSALKGMGIDPSTKVGCWSDSLDVDLSIAIAEHFNRRLKVAFGIGTFLCATIIKFKNGAVRKPLSMVMKVVMVKGGFNAKWVYVVKLSDSVGKTMCPDEKYIEHVKDVFEYVSIDDTMPEAS